MTVCENCGTLLDNCSEIVAVKGFLYCERACAISHMTYRYKTNAFELASEEYEECAEVISPKDAGILPGHIQHLVEFVQFSQGVPAELASKVAMELLDAIEELIEEKVEELEDEQSR